MYVPMWGLGKERASGGRGCPAEVLTSFCRALRSLTTAYTKTPKNCNAARRLTCCAAVTQVALQVLQRN